jgi:pimeloyl-ACP methyl ester carboxylesterase
VGAGARADLSATFSDATGLLKALQRGLSAMLSAQEEAPLTAEEELACAVEALRALGYAYNTAGELRSVEGAEPFRFSTQAHYEKLALAVAGYVQALLVASHGMQRRLVHGVDVFCTPDSDTCDVLLVLLCGAGAVAAGQWARRLCINESLTTGTVVPYLQWAVSRGFGCCVLNPNHRRASSEEHTVDAWKALVEPSQAHHVLMVAHSYGGVCTAGLLSQQLPSVTQRLRGVALTDSVHGRSVERLQAAERQFFSQRCCNWVTSSETLDTPVRPAVNQPPWEQSSDEGAPPIKRSKTDLWQPPWCDAARLSAGHTAHESTSEACRPSACAFLLRMLRQAGWQGGAEEQAEGAAHTEQIVEPAPMAVTQPVPEPALMPPPPVVAAEQGNAETATE